MRRYGTLCVPSSNSCESLHLCPRPLLPHCSIFGCHRIQTIICPNHLGWTLSFVAGQLLAPAEGFGQGFFYRAGQKKSYYAVLAHFRPFLVSHSNLGNFSSIHSHFDKNPKNLKKPKKKQKKSKIQKKSKKSKKVQKNPRNAKIPKKIPKNP